VIRMMPRMTWLELKLREHQTRIDKLDKRIAELERNHYELCLTLNNLVDSFKLLTDFVRLKKDVNNVQDQETR